MVALIMHPSFRHGDAPELPGRLGESYYFVATFHAMRGDTTELLALFEDTIPKGLMGHRASYLGDNRAICTIEDFCNIFRFGKVDKNISIEGFIFL
jgi:hypothetical protein